MDSAELQAMYNVTVAMYRQDMLVPMCPHDSPTERQKTERRMTEHRMTERRKTRGIE
jgi:hypothetical protein